MKMRHWMLSLVVVACCTALLGITPVIAVDDKWDIDEMSDMSDFDPNNPVIPEGDVIKIGLLTIFSGPGAGNGEIFWLTSNWVAHEINKRGGIMVDGKMKKVVFIKGDTIG